MNWRTFAHSAITRLSGWLMQFVCCLTAIVMFSLPANADIYVSPDGSDCNQGDAENPVTSLQKARDLIREKRRQNGVADNERITVWLEEGVYELTEPLVLGPQDSEVSYRAIKGAAVHIVGGRTIAPSSFRRVVDSAVLKRLDCEVAKERVRQVDLNSQGISNFGKLRRHGHMLPVVPAPLELFIDGQAMPLARYPNDSDIELKTIIDPGSIPRIGDYSERGGTFVYSDPRHARWEGLDDVWIQGTFHYGYADDNIRIARIDPANRQVTLEGEHMYGLAGDAPYRKYRVYNLLEELDEPGEWYLDRETGVLYLWPAGELAQATILVSILEDPLLCLERASKVLFQGVTFEAGRGIGIYIEGGHGNIIRDCTIRNVGTTGILMGKGAEQTFPHITHDDYEGKPIARQVGNLQSHLYKDTTWDREAGNGHEIINCVVHSTGAGGIYLSGGSKRELIPGGARVSDCLIHDYNRHNKFLWAGVNVDGCGNQVSHCEIYGSDFQGIFVRGNEHLFEYNYLHDLALDSDDTSAWYVGRDPSDRGHVLRYNYFENIGRPDRMVMGVYLDDGGCGVEVVGNVFYRTATRGSVYSNSGHNVRVVNNIFVESRGPAVELYSIWYGISDEHLASFFGKPPHLNSGKTAEQSPKAMYTSDSKGLYERRLLELIDIRKPPYSVRYPELADFMEYLEDGVTRVGQRPRDFHVSRNVIYDCQEAIKLRGAYASIDKGDNFICDVDPGFADLERRDFTLSEDSVVFATLPDFEPIPFRKIGRRSKITE